MSNRAGAIRSALAPILQFFFGPSSSSTTRSAELVQAQLHLIRAPADTPDGAAALRAIHERKVLEARRSQKRTRIVGLMFFIATLSGLYFVGSQPWVYILSFGSILMFDVARPGLMTQEEYYSLPGTRDDEGRHRCFYCGHQEEKIHPCCGSNIPTAVGCSSCGERAY